MLKTKKRYVYAGRRYHVIKNQTAQPKSFEYRRLMIKNFVFNLFLQMLFKLTACGNSRAL